MEPGPVVTEFERKVYEEAERMDLSGTDEETARIFRELYLPYSKKVFASLGQTPEEVAEASVDSSNCHINVIQNEVLIYTNVIVYHSANFQGDHSQGASSAAPNEPAVHAHDCTEACRSHWSTASGRLL